MSQVDKLLHNFQKTAREKMVRMADLIIKKHTREGIGANERAELAAIVAWRSDLVARI